jgi:DNA processing protein
MNKLSSLWLAFARIPGIHAKLAEKLLSQTESIESFFQLSRAALVAMQLPQKCVSAVLSPDWKQVERTMKWLEGMDHSVVFWFEPDYPALLQEIYRPPLMLYVKGNKERLQEYQLAIVGSRKATPRGFGMAKRFAAELAGCGFSISSGLALGIDRAAHEGALQVSGGTVAVLANGLDQVYPRSHQGLAGQIIDQGGALISEYPLGTSPLACYFPQRNRLISGMSLGVLVIEAAMKSGSLVTARLASEQGREVFAVPGDIQSPVSKGCHALIQNGAKLTSCVKDVLQELPVVMGEKSTAPQAKSSTHLSDDPLKVLSLFGNAVFSSAQIAMESDLAFDQVCSMLVQLEIDGYLKSVTGGYIRTMKEPSE